mgnify:FL=1
MGYTEPNQSVQSPPENLADTEKNMLESEKHIPDSDVEDEFKLFYSLNKMLKYPPGSSNFESKASSEPKQSPIRARMVAKAIVQLDHKLETLKDSLDPKKLHTVMGNNCIKELISYPIER